MIVLGIETATQVCGVALVNNDALIGEYRTDIKNAHGRLLAGAIESLLRDAGMTTLDIQGIAISIGPGSFTGLRIGLSMAKGLALATGAPITSVDTLAALAAQAPLFEGLIAPVIRSRADEYYMACYQRKAGTDTLLKAAEIIRWENLSTFIPADTCLIGQTGEQPVPDEYQAAPAAFAYLSGFTIARLGYRQFLGGQTDNSDLLEPRYMQDFIAGKPKPSILTA